MLEEMCIRDSPNYVAKRMEIGAVLGAAPRRAVIRETSDPGDIIVLLGGCLLYTSGSRACYTDGRG